MPSITEGESIRLTVRYARVCRGMPSIIDSQLETVVVLIQESGNCFIESFEGAPSQKDG